MTIKYELYQNLGPLKSILRAPEHKMLGGGTMYPPPSKVGLMLKLNTEQLRSQNQDELHQKHIVSKKQEGTEEDEMTAQENIANEVDLSEKKSMEQVQQLLTLCGPLVESPGE